MVHKHALELVRGSLRTPDNQTSVVIPLPPATGNALFHFAAIIKERAWSIEEFHHLEKKTAIGCEKNTLRFILLVISDDLEDLKTPSVPVREKL